MIFSDVVFGSVPTSKVNIDSNELSARLGVYNCDMEQLRPYFELFEKTARYKYAYTIVPCSVNDDECNLDFVVTKSKALAKVLSTCASAIVVCSTAGIEVDRLISRKNLQSPSDGYIMDAMGSAAVEGLMDYVTDLLHENYSITNRFSPGYADLSLGIQNALLERLNAFNTLGITLSNELMMTPMKSITAIIGIKERSTDEQHS